MDISMFILPRGSDECILQAIACRQHPVTESNSYRTSH